MSQQNSMAGKTAADLVQAIATSLYGEAGAGITGLITLANRVKASAAGGLALLLDQQRVTVVADHSQPIAAATLGAHEVHAEVIDVRLDPAGVRELCPAPDALVHCPGVRQEDDRLMTGGIAVQPFDALDLASVRAALQAAEGLCACCASVDGYSRRELSMFGRNMRTQFRDALALIDRKAVSNG